MRAIFIMLFFAAMCFALAASCSPDTYMKRIYHIKCELDNKVILDEKVRYISTGEIDLVKIRRFDGTTVKTHPSNCVITISKVKTKAKKFTREEFSRWWKGD